MAWWSVLALIAAAGTWLRLWGVGRKWLWWDELLSANFAYGEWYTVITEALRFDPHPPVYYLQLHLWMALGGTSDLWLMLNPVAWSAAGVISTGWVARRLFGGSAGWFAAALYAVMAAPVYLAVQVRMYSMIPALAVWCFWLHRQSARGECGWRTAAGACILEAAIAYSHGTGMLMLAGLYAYGLWESVRSGRLNLWMRWRLLSVLLVAPSLLLALLKWTSVGHPIRPDFAEIGRALLWMLLNPSVHSRIPPGETQWIALGWAAWLLWAWLAASSGASRVLALCCVVFPIAVQAAVSVWIRPVWYPRNLSVVFPFFCLAAAGGFGLGRRAQVIAGCALAPILAGGTVTQQLAARKGDDFKPAAQLTRRLTRPGDLVVFYGHTYDWFCFSWYHRGPDWGDPLADYSSGRATPRLRRWLDLTGTHGLMFHGEVREWWSDGARVVTEYTAPPDWSGAGRVIRVISAPRWSMLRNRTLPPVAGRALVHAESGPRGQVKIEVWQ